MKTSSDIGNKSFHLINHEQLIYIYEQYGHGGVGLLDGDYSQDLGRENLNKIKMGPCQGGNGWRL